MSETDVLPGLLRTALIAAWEQGHRDGIGCGHDLAVCRHKDGGEEVDDIAWWDDRVKAAMAASPSSEGLSGDLLGDAIANVIEDNENAHRWVGQHILGREVAAEYARLLAGTPQ